MTTVAIMQPTYLPWLGYFALAAQVDIFVFLDSVQFVRRSWQQRNRIKMVQGSQWLTVRVLSKGSRDQLISEVAIDSSSDFAQKHIGSIRHAYGRAKCFEPYHKRLFEVLRQNHALLSDLNVDLITDLARTLDLDCRFLRSSSLGILGTKDHLLANICDHLSADRYVSTPGSEVYLSQSTAFENKGIEVVYGEYEHPRYPQCHGTFMPSLSIVDLLFNAGDESKTILLKGIRKFNR